MIVLEANYSKKLGLPGYSSHQYSLTVRKEVSDISQVEKERVIFWTWRGNEVTANVSLLQRYITRKRRLLQDRDVCREAFPTGTN
jgi:erythromycin esterase-like protein